jgi:cellulose synthase/poly-beta-1,6-N-acetylglucosamine synthase-like glycosyltransferase
MTASIIIAVKEWQRNLEECVNKCLALEADDYEIIVLPDQGMGLPLKAAPLRVIPTGAVSPALKRDIALKAARGDILAFIDDDAYPRADWLKNALRDFQDAAIVAVGGPAVTPAEDSFRQKASGFIYSSFLVSAGFTYRYLPGKKRRVDDFPSCNFFLRRETMRRLGGFNTAFWPGEDTKLCLDIVNSGGKILYDPEALVFHHRRPVFKAHLRQVASYALHRGFFVKRYPGNSLKLTFFIPSLFLLSLFLGAPAAFFLPAFRQVFLFALGLYGLAVFLASLGAGARMFFLVFPGIILTHLAYGLYFLKGLFSLRLSEEPLTTND